MDDSLKTIWANLMERINEKITSPIIINTWFKPAVPIKIENNTLTLSVENEIAYNMFIGNYDLKLKEALREVTNQNLNVNYIIGLPKEEKKEIKENDAVINLSEHGNLNPKYTFDSFVIGNSNRFAHAACLAVADSLSNTYNPLFIYGGVGLGKTHLMHAIGNHVRMQNPNAKVVYVSTEKFMNEMIYSIANKTNEQFREKYRTNVDVILLDDIQFIGGKPGTQEELFHTFNDLKDNNKQIIMSSDRPPIEIPTLEDRLRTRFASGLVADIQQPDLETRVAILKKKSEVDSLIINDEILLYIATNVKSNIRELEGALNKVVAYSRLIGVPITQEVAEESLKGIVSESKGKDITVDSIIEIVANYHSITVEDIKGKVRARNLALPRQIAMYLSRELINMSLPKLGECFGKDHSTVIHAHEKIRSLIDQDPEIKNRIDTLTKRLKSE